MELDVCVPMISQYLKPEASPEEKASIIQQLTQLLKAGDTSILTVVASLQDWLISEDEERRAQGTRMLAEVLQQVSSHLTSNDLHHLVAFTTARLSDWPCTEAAADGALALLETGTGKLNEADAVSIVRVGMEEIAGHVQQLVQKDRAALLRLLLRSTQLWGVAAARSNINLVEGCVAAVDGEKDPRCLLLSFQLIQAVAQVYHSRSVDPQPWITQCEEVVEVLSCYFPLAFHPPKTNPHKITREQLAGALMGSLSCSPFLAQWVLPLVLEKLSSTYKPAKDDALAALTACCQRYGPEAMQPHLAAVWSALRSELMGPSSFGLTGGEELATARQLADQAAVCLVQCCRAPVGDRLTAYVIQDDKVTGDLLSSVQQAKEQGPGPTREGGDPHRCDRQLLCAATILGAVCASSAAAAEQVCSAVLVRLLDSLPSSSLSDSALQWASPRSLYALAASQQLLHQVVCAVQQLSSDPGTRPAAEQLLSKVHPHAICVFQAVISGLQVLVPVLTGGNEQQPGAVDKESARQVLLTCCSTTGILLALHQCCPPTQCLLTPQDLASALACFTTCSLTDGEVASASLLTESTAHQMAWRLACTAADASLEAVLKIVQAAADLQASQAATAGEGMLKQLVQQVVSRLSGILTGDQATRAVHVSECLAQALPVTSGLLLAELVVLVEAACIRLASPDLNTVSAVKRLLALLDSCLAGAGNPPVPSASSSALHMLLSLLLRIPPPLGSARNPQQQQDVSTTDQQVDADLVCTLAGVAGRLAASCTSSQQSELESTVYGLLQNPSLPTVPCIVSCSVLAGLRPTSVPADHAHQLITWLTSFPQHRQFSRDGALAQLGYKAAAVALASLVNKASTSEQQQFDGVASDILAALGLPTAPSSALVGSTHTGADREWQLAAVPWLIAALAKRGSPLAVSAVQLIINQLSAMPWDHSSPLTQALAGGSAAGDVVMKDVTGNDMGQQGSGAMHHALLAAHTFLVMLTDDTDTSSLTWHHVTNRLLWQQRMVTTCVPMLLQQVQQPGHRQHELLHLALAACLSSAPQHMLASHLPTIVQVLPDCLASLLKLSSEVGGVAAAPDAVPDECQQLSGAAQLGVQGQQQLLVAAMREPSTAALLEPYVQELLPLICDTCTLKGSAFVREMGISLLSLSQQALPYHLLHPFKSKVLATINLALDDDKRAVRQQAARCRRHWSSK